MSSDFRLYIDDIRVPKSMGWFIERSSQDAIDFIEDYGCPDYISFDHDLGGDDTAMVVVKWLIEKDLDANGNYIPEHFEFNVHSANPVGVQNIEGMLNSYLKFREV